MRVSWALATGALVLIAQPGWAQRDPAPRGRRAQVPLPPSPQPAVPDGDQGYGYDPYAYGFPPIDYLPPPAPAGPAYRGGRETRTTPDGRGTVSTVTVGGTPGFVGAGSQPQRDGEARGASVTSAMTDPGFDPAPPPHATRKDQRRRASTGSRVP